MKQFLIEFPRLAKNHCAEEQLGTNQTDYSGI